MFQPANRAASQAIARSAAGSLPRSAIGRKARKSPTPRHDSSTARAQWTCAGVRIGSGAAKSSRASSRSSGASSPRRWARRRSLMASRRAASGDSWNRFDASSTRRQRRSGAPGMNWRASHAPGNISVKSSIVRRPRALISTSARTRTIEISVCVRPNFRPNSASKGNSRPSIGSGNGRSARANRSHQDASCGSASSRFMARR